MPNTEQELNDISLIEARRNAARKAFTDELIIDNSVGNAVEAAITSAAAVTITPELMNKVWNGTELRWLHEVENTIRVVLAAAGFEVKP